MTEQYRDNVTYDDALKLAWGKWGDFGGSAVRCPGNSQPCAIEGYDSGGRRRWYGATWREASEKAGLIEGTAHV